MVRQIAVLSKELLLSSVSLRPETCGSILCLLTLSIHYPLPTDDWPCHPPPLYHHNILAFPLLK